MKFCYGGSIGRLVYPVFMLVIGLSTEELPDDEIIVLPIEGLIINEYIDSRNEEPGYICCVGSNILQNISLPSGSEQLLTPQSNK